MLATLGVNKPMNRTASKPAVPIIDHSPRAVVSGSRTTRELSMVFEYRTMSSLGSARKRQRSSIGTNPDCAAPLAAPGAARGLRKNIASVAMIGYLSISPLLHLERAQLGAARRRIQIRFLVRRRQGTLGQDRGAAFLRQAAEPLLHFAVFQRHEGDHYHAAAARQQLRSDFQQAVEFALLVVHKHA